MSGTTVDPEDAKIVTLARSTRARNRTAEGAAVRDENGRTYVASTVDLPSLRLTALQAAVAMAVAGGARDLEAAAIVGESGALAEADRAVVRDLGGVGTAILLAAPDGSVTEVAEA
ncbi:cytidine deaminase [Yinghuangia sp. ASG 101]|uniref:cytidine deaminase n=1 Tax=Yinghuangia sp. ASG 101 TaxID=2896848 RepID=UPI001E4C036E|nr:cytidine deaminase [Yinghuangia sp. ASG 101]UGQ09856.1 cytidine deaminase [Yinghuangia sp. ASG 101]